ncbi:MAG: universal stress protein [Actinomycetota bacterium]|nr:universal stress protein [Actinomycetota bacterium]
MFDKLAVAVDQSEESDRAVAAARDLALLSHGVVRLLHVREAQVVAGKGGGVFELEEVEDIEQLLQKEIAVFEAAGVPVTTELRHAVLGHTAIEIVAGAEEYGADVIVMGCRGRSELASLVLGSNAYKVLHLAKRPVLIVR